MNGQQTLTHDHNKQCCSNRISVKALFTGAFIGMGIGFLLQLFYIAIGLSAFTTNTEGLFVLAIGGLIGLLIGTIVTTFVAGYAAAYLGRSFCCKRNLGVIYGFTTWCLMLVLTVMFASHLGRYVSSYASFVSQPTIVKVISIDQVNGQAQVSATTPASGGEVVSVATSSVGMGAFIIFILFFVGALASCFGGHYGMYARDCCKDKDMNKGCCH